MANPEMPGKDPKGPARDRLRATAEAAAAKLHGGKSTGPRTEVGKARAAEGLRRYWDRRRVKSSGTVRTA